MSLRRQFFTAYLTIVHKEIVRFSRIWIQTLLPPAITMTLYFVIFGTMIGSRVGTMSGFSYMQFIVPGLVMMPIITSAYAGVSSGLFSARFQRSIEELLVAPVPNIIILLGYISGGVLRSMLVGMIVIIISLFFSRLHIQHLGLVLLVALLSAILFTLAGFLNAIYAKKFDDISIIPTFVLTPLTYLGGVFYSVSLLPPVWHTLSFFNPVLYIVNAFRYGILGVSDVSVGAALLLLIGFIAILAGLCLHLLNKGVGFRT